MGMADGVLLLLVVCSFLCFGGKHHEICRAHSEVAGRSRSCWARWLEDSPAMNKGEVYKALSKLVVKSATDATHQAGKSSC